MLHWSANPSLAVQQLVNNYLLNLSTGSTIGASIGPPRPVISDEDRQFTTQHGLLLNNKKTKVLPIRMWSHSPSLFQTNKSPLWVPRRHHLQESVLVSAHHQLIQTTMLHRKLKDASQQSKLTEALCYPCKLEYCAAVWDPHTHQATGEHGILANSNHSKTAGLSKVCYKIINFSPHPSPSPRHPHNTCGHLPQTLDVIPKWPLEVVNSPSQWRMQDFWKGGSRKVASKIKWCGAKKSEHAHTNAASAILCQVHMQRLQFSYSCRLHLALITVGESYI